MFIWCLFGAITYVMMEVIELSDRHKEWKKQQKERTEAIN